MPRIRPAILINEFFVGWRSSKGRSIVEESTRDSEKRDRGENSQGLEPVRQPRWDNSCTRKNRNCRELRRIKGRKKKEKPCYIVTDKLGYLNCDCLNGARPHLGIKKKNTTGKNSLRILWLS